MLEGVPSSCLPPWLETTMPSTPYSAHWIASSTVRDTLDYKREAREVSQPVEPCPMLSQHSRAGSSR